MKSFIGAAATAALFSTAAFACDTCYGPASRVEHVRLAKRIQPGAPEATYGPTRPLEWGQVNFMHTVCIEELEASKSIVVCCRAGLISNRPTRTVGSPAI